MQNLKQFLKNSVDKYGKKILYREKGITYIDFQKKVNNLGTALIDIGLKDKKIAILSENRYEWEVAFFSVICGSGVLVPIDKSYSKFEIENIINKAKIEAIFCSNKYETILKEIQKNNNYLKYIFSFDSNSENSYTNLINKGQKLINEGNNSFVDANIDEDSVCIISFTSGTTDFAKAVMLTQKNIYSNTINTGKVFDLTVTDIVLSILPLNHVLEGLFCLLLSIQKGAERVFCNELDEIIDYLKKDKITFMGAVPAIYEYLYKRKDELKLEANHINMFMSGGASLNKELIVKYKEIGIDLVQGYGLTECSPVVSIENKDMRKNGSVRKGYTKY